MKKGDLVNFYSAVDLFIKDYRTRNPGLIIALERSCKVMPQRPGSAYIMWKNGDITREHITYLEVIDESSRRLLDV